MSYSKMRPSLFYKLSFFTLCLQSLFGQHMHLSKQIVLFTPIVYSYTKCSDYLYYVLMKSGYSCWTIYLLDNYQCHNLALVFSDLLWSYIFLQFSFPLLLIHLLVIFIQTLVQVLFIEVGAKLCRKVYYNEQ